ncbi:MAG: toxin PIN [Spirochaetes bacterium]|nr:MAG: toxin PIN [Spirochaetota bacterium]
MNSHVLDSLVTDYEELIEGLFLPDLNGRHVLAAAIKSGSSAIITFNLDDFPENELIKYGIEALHPDDFVSSQFDLGAGKVCLAAKRQRNSLINPPKTVFEYLDTLAKQQLPKTVSNLREYMDLI